MIDTSPHSFAWAAEVVIAAANTHPRPAENLNISFLHVIGENGVERISQTNVRLVYIGFCTDRLMC